MPYIHYLSNGRYCTFLTHTGGGLSFWKTPPAYSINLWNQTLGNLPGKYVYIKDGNDMGGNATDGNAIWSINWRPMKKKMKWQCRVGLGYQKIMGERNGLKGEITYFVPPQEDVEYWVIDLENKTNKIKEIEVYPMVELLLGHLQFNTTHYNFNVLFNKVYQKGNALIAEKSYWGREIANKNAEWPIKVFFAGNMKPVAYETMQESFFGPGGDRHDPRGVIEGKLSNKTNNGRPAMFAYKYKIKLKPKTSKRLVMVLGVAEKDSDIKKASLLVKNSVASKNYKDTLKYWDNLVSQTKIKTPNKDLDNFINYWNKYQNQIVYWWYRSDGSYFIAGGFEPWGFRDSAQTMIGGIHNHDKEVKKRLKFHASLVKPDGSLDQNYIPDLNKSSGIPANIDVGLWLPITLMIYIKETGDFGILTEKVAAEGLAVEGLPPKGAAPKDTTMYEIMVKLMEHVWKTRSKRNLVLIDRGDWNDAMNFMGREGRGETVMVSETLLYLLNEWIILSKRIGKPTKKFEDMAKKLKTALEKNCWDGEWYVRGTNDQGRTFGSKKNKKAKIFLNAQSWAVLAGLKKAKKGMESAHKHLFTKYGPFLYRPAFDSSDNQVGIITRFAPGVKENGAIFVHPVAWATMAWALLGDGDRAMQYHMSVLPNMCYKKNPEKYYSEPYVYAEYTAGPDSEYYGEGSHSWFTGCPPWHYHVFISYLLGIKADYDGIYFNPCLPKGWKRVEVKRKIRGIEFDISIDVTAGLSRACRGGFSLRIKKHPRQVGATTIKVNGKPLKSNFLPYPKTRKKIKVKIKYNI